MLSSHHSFLIYILIGSIPPSLIFLSLWSSHLLLVPVSWFSCFIIQMGSKRWCLGGCWLDATNETRRGSTWHPYLHIFHKCLLQGWRYAGMFRNHIIDRMIYLYINNYDETPFVSSIILVVGVFLLGFLKLDLCFFKPTWVL